jgi:hypothetical protein
MGYAYPAPMPTLTYFSLLGAAYMFIQIVLIQRFTFFIGYPIHATTTTIASMVAFAAIGSLVIGKHIRSVGCLAADTHQYRLPDGSLHRCAAPTIQRLDALARPGADCRQYADHRATRHPDGHSLPYRPAPA